jgi:predicted aspartyl protease
MTITVPLQIIDLHDDGFHPLINVTIYGKLFILVLDTGASRTAFDHQMLLEVSENASIQSSDKLSTGLGTNNMASSTALISDMHIADFAVPEFEVAVLDLSSINIAYRQLNHPEVLGVLGGDILMEYKAVIDYGKKIIKFKV